MLGGAAGEGPWALRRERVAGPTDLKHLSPCPLSRLGRLCFSAAFLPGGWDKPALGKGLLGHRPPAPPPALLWNLMYLNTQAQIFTAQTGSAPGHSQAGAAEKKKKKKIDLVASSLPWCFGRFPVSSSSPRTPGLPRPWGPRDSGLWFGKLADEVFVCY